MEDCQDYSLSGLEKCNYRYLQQKAKSMSLPSNVKKVYLIQLIHAKMFGTPGQVESIIEQVRSERQQMANRKRGRNKRKRLQNTEISSTSLHHDLRLKSPPISLSHSPNLRRSFGKFKPNIPMGSPLRTYQIKKPECSMVLRNRSCPITGNPRKMYGEPSNLTSLLKSNASPEKKPKDLRVVVRNMDGLSSQLLNPRCLIQHRPSILAGSPQRVKNVYVQTMCMPKSRPKVKVVPAMSSVVELTPSPSPSKRQRALSGIYPIQSLEPKPITYNYVQSDLGIRNRDGTYSKINALVQRPTNKPLQADNNNVDITIRDIIHSACVASTRNKQTENDNYVPYQTQNSTPTQNSFVTTNSNAVIDVTTSTGSNEPKESSELNLMEYCQKRQSNESEASSDMNLLEYCQKQQSNDSKESSELNLMEYCQKQQSNDSKESSELNLMEYCQKRRLSESKASSDMNLMEYGQKRQLNESSELNLTEVTEYCHKKIRAEQVRTRRESGFKRDRGEVSLPRIHEVFSSFRNVASDAPPPIYAQANDAPDPTALPPLEPATSSPALRLETLYNLLLPPRVTTAPNNTHTVYSTPILPTPMEYNTSTAYSAQCNIASCEQVDLQTNNIYNYIMLSEQELTNKRDMSSPLSQLACRVDDIPELVEDALELISQDGDYMERIGMEARAGCVLCEWAGPACLLDNHLRKEHQSRIHKLSSQEWNITYRLGDVTRAPHTEVLQSVRGALYALTAHYRDPDRFMCEIQSLTLESEAPITCTLTVYNRVTGEPFSWTGVIPHVNMTSEPGLRIKLSSLELLPNSAKLQLLNRELVGHGMGNVVCGQPELDDIHVIVFVKI